MAKRETKGSFRLKDLPKVGLPIGLAAALVAALLWLSLFNKSLVEQITTLKIKIDRHNREIANLSLLKQASQQAVELEPKLNALLPDTERLLSVSAELDNLAGAMQLSQKFTFGNELPATDAEPKAVGFNLFLSGDIIKMLEYLKRIEALPYVVKLGQIDINHIAGVYQMNASGKIYSQ